MKKSKHLLTLQKTKTHLQKEYISAEYFHVPLRPTFPNPPQPSSHSSPKFGVYKGKPERRLETPIQKNEVKNLGSPQNWLYKAKLDFLALP